MNWKRMTFLMFVWVLAATSFAAPNVEVEVDDLSSSTTATIVATPKDSVGSTVTPSIEPSRGSAPSSVVTAEPTKIQTKVPTEVPTPDPTPLIAHGILKMKDIYEAGIQSYKEGDYASAITYLKRALEQKDGYTPKYYYAEANAMLGAIYQFHLIDKKLALKYYQAALEVDPTTATARKHIGEVSDMKKPTVKAKKSIELKKKAVKGKKTSKAKKTAKSKSKKKSSPKKKAKSKKKSKPKPKETNEEDL